MADLDTMRTAHQAAHAKLNSVIAAEFPGMDEWHWLRAVAHMAGDNCRRNDDTSCDQALAESSAIRAAWDDYVAKLHGFYRARDGEHGVLGGRGL